jgi:hypothetical protein
MPFFYDEDLNAARNVDFAVAEHNVDLNLAFALLNKTQYLQHAVDAPKYYNKSCVPESDEIYK